MRCRYAIATAGLLLAMSGCGGGQATTPTTPSVTPQPTFTLSGTVRDGGNTNLVEGARIEVSSTGAPASVQTGFPGTFSLTGLRGTVSITASATGYATTTRSLDIAANTTTDFTLERAGGRAVPCGDAAGPGNRVVPMLSRPFAGEFSLGNYFDHDSPFEFVDTNGYQVTACGDRITGQVDGHQGYDWLMPTGTPLLATHDGTVQVFSGEGFCPPLNRNVTTPVVGILTDAGSPLGVTAEYFHTSRIDVVNGQRVTRGQVIALSGNTGCSTAPHLHFQIRALANGNPQVDPYGWEGTGRDPWAQHAQGVPSYWMWRPGEAPRLRR